MDECDTHLSVSAKEWFIDMGAKNIKNLGYRSSYVFIGVYG